MNFVHDKFQYKQSHSGGNTGISIRLKPDASNSEFSFWVEKYGQTFNSLNLK